MAWLPIGFHASSKAQFMGWKRTEQQQHDWDPRAGRHQHRQKPGAPGGGEGGGAGCLKEPQGSGWGDCWDGE